MYIRLRDRNIHDESYYYCLCKTHVRTGAFAIAIWDIINGFISILMAWHDFGFGLSKANASTGLFLILVCVLMVYADREERPRLYLPWLILKAISITVCIFSIFSLFILGCVAPSIDLDIPGFEGKTLEEKLFLERILFFGGAVALTLFTLLEGYFWSIVFKAYQYMRDAVQEGVLGHV